MISKTPTHYTTLFIIPLKSSKNDKDWDLTCKLLNQTLSSIEGQTTTDHHTFIVCNEMPKITANSDKTSILSTDICIEGEYTHKKGCLDKQQKVYYGLLKARELNPHYVMIVDADDLIHRDLLSYCHNQSGYDGFILNKGYVLPFGHKHMTKRNDFHLLSASSVIFSYNQDYFQNQNDVRSDFLNYHMTNTPHDVNIENNFKKLGVKFRFVPFYAGIYLRSYGNSLTDDESSTSNFTFTRQQKIIKFVRKVRRRIFNRVKITIDLANKFNWVDK
jgi:hypothetical protein